MAGKNFNKMGKLLGWIACVLVVTQCSFRSDQGEPLSANASQWQQINAEIIQTKCVSCHSGAAAAGGADFSSYQNLLSSGAIIPGQLQQSSFYLQIASGNMPKGQGALSSSETQLVASWIQNGAQQTDPQTLQPPSQGSGPSVVGSATFTYINAYILQPKCVSCHNSKNGYYPPNGIDLSSYDSVIESGAVATSTLEQSPLVTDVVNGIMPPANSGYALSPSDISIIQAWVTQGALNN